MEQVERGEKLDELKKYLFFTVKAILYVLNKLILDMHQERIQRPRRNFHLLLYLLK